MLLGVCLVWSRNLRAESAADKPNPGNKTCAPLELANARWYIRPGLTPLNGLTPPEKDGAWTRIHTFPVLPNVLFPEEGNFQGPRDFTLLAQINADASLVHCRNPALFFPSIGESFRVFWNRELLLNKGLTDGSRTYAYQRDLTLPLSGPIAPGKNRLLIHISGHPPRSHLSPNVYFGLGRPGGYMLSDRVSLRSRVHHADLYAMIGVYAFAALMGLLLFFRIPSETIHAYFAGLCVSLAGYFLALSPLAFQSMEDTSYLIKIAYSCKIGTLLFAGLFLHGFIFPEEQRPNVLNMFIGANLIPAALIIALPIQYSGSLLRIWYVVVVLQFAWMMFLLTRGLRLGRKNAPAMTLSIVAAAICVIWDVLDTRVFSSGHRLMHLSFLIFLVSKTAMLISRFIGMHENAIKLNSQLDSKVRELNAAGNRLEFLAHNDPLTNLPNRFRFVENLNARMRRVKSKDDFAVLLVDLDRFKNINDAFGHDFGDALLKAVSHRILGALESEDQAARFDGDAFSIRMEAVDSKNVHEKAARILQILRLPYIIDDIEITCSASIGIVLGGPQYTDARAMLRDADTAMYRAKRKRSEYRIFEEPMRRAVTSSLTLEAELQKAIEERTIQIHYQPIVSMRTGAMTGVEALVRWEHETMGKVSPLTLIPFAEDTGLIVPLGAFVLEEACRQARRWDAEGHRGLSVSVNVSAIQIHRTGFVEMLEGVLQETGLPPNRLVLELTESLLMESDNRVLETVKRARKTGIRIAVDDFGTGYSSLSYLHELPLDILKIDRAFTRNLPGKRDAAAITRTIIALAHNLGLVVTAEGIENQEQLEFLRNEACATGQGYLFSPPMPGHAIVGWTGEPSPQ